MWSYALKGGMPRLTKPIKRALIWPDKFKFSLSAPQVATTIRQGLPPPIETKIITLADGGEGSLETIATKIKGNWVSCEVSDPLLRPIKAEYFATEQGEAFIQMARASGLGLLSAKERNISLTSTFGTGQLVLDSLRRGSKRVNLLIGGSATNDGGIGCAAALGFTFYDAKGSRLDPVGGSLGRIAAIRQQEGEKKQLLRGAQIAVFTDVVNPLTGPKGATFVYGPQKGGHPQQLQDLDRGMTNLNRVFKQQFGVDAQLLPGSGAAGGLGAGCMVLLKASLRRGVDLIFRVTGFEQEVRRSDVVITGEGKFDGQTLEGKVVQGVLQRCLHNNKPVLVLCALAEGAETLTGNPLVHLAQVLSDEQKQVIDSQVTRRRLRQTVFDIFNQQ